MADEGPVQNLCEETTCSICLEYFTDPVIIDCGHIFCQSCITEVWGEPDRDASCPQCSEPCQQRNVRPNQQLASIVEIVKKFSLQMARGAEALGRVCERHQEPLKLFCEDDQDPICVVCDKSKEHRDHKVIPKEEAFEEYQGKILHHLEFLNKQREEILSSKLKRENESQNLLKQTDMERQKIMADFQQLHQFLEEQESLLLAQLKELDDEIKSWEGKHIAKLSEEMSSIDDLIKELEEKQKQPTTEFLQNMRSILERCNENENKNKTMNAIVFPPGLKEQIDKFSKMHPFLEKTTKKFKESLEEAQNKADSLLLSSRTESVQQDEETSCLRKLQRVSSGDSFQPSLRSASMREGDARTGRQGSSLGALRRVSSVGSVMPSSTPETIQQGEMCIMREKSNSGRLGKIESVNIVLDPETANHYLILSEDGKSVRCGGERQNLPDSRKRFDPKTYVLGSERFRAVTQAAPPNINATETPVPGSPTTNEERETTCSICREYLTDPVTLDCGHNFCRGCITCYCKILENQDGGALKCPLCKSRIQKWNFRSNLQLAETVEGLKLLPLKLYKERTQSQLKSLEKEKQNLVNQKQTEEEEKEKCLKQLNKEKQKIKDAFEKMQNSLEEKESSSLARLRNLEKEIKKKVAENGNRLSEDISYLTKLIAELEEKCEQPPQLFLQDIESTLLREKRAEHSADLSTWLEERLKICCQKNSTLVNAMVKCADSLEEALKKEGLNKFLTHTTAPLEQKPEKVSVTLDPLTAHPLLALSADLKSVKVGDVPDDQAENTDELLSIPYVLGREKFASGRHWWEAELDLNEEDKEYMDQECLWIVGAARESFQGNKGFDLSPKAGVWAVGVSPFSKKLTAFTSRKPSHSHLAHQVRKIRVSLDYKARQVEFFDADTDASIFTFSAASFAGEAIRPFFCLGGEGLELKCGN